MSSKACIQYYYHSGFSIEVEKKLLIFDYWQGQDHDIPEELKIRPEKLKKYEQVIIFISHHHPDHFDPEILTWLIPEKTLYVAGFDVRLPIDGTKLSPGEEKQLLPEVRVSAFDSTDDGVSFLVKVDGWRFFHAGDLNFWHWREESSFKEIEEAENAFHKAMAPIIDLKERIDLAFFPVDARQGTMFEAGANYFIMSVKPRYLLPMHFWGRSDLMESFARQARTRETQVIPLTRPGDKLILTEEDGIYEAQLIQAPVVRRRTMDEEDPFNMTELPVDLGE